MRLWVSHWAVRCLLIWSACPTGFLRADEISKIPTSEARSLFEAAARSAIQSSGLGQAARAATPAQSLKPSSQVLPRATSVRGAPRPASGSGIPRGVTGGSVPAPGSGTYGQGSLGGAPNVPSQQIPQQQQLPQGQ